MDWFIDLFGGSIVLSFVISAIWIVVWALLSRLIANAIYKTAQNKGDYSNHHFWAFCFWLGILGIVISIVIANSLPEKKDNTN